MTSFSPGHELGNCLERSQAACENPPWKLSFHPWMLRKAIDPIAPQLQDVNASSGCRAASERSPSMRAGSKLQVGNSTSRTRKVMSFRTINRNHQGARRASPEKKPKKHKSCLPIHQTLLSLPFASVCLLNRLL